MGYSILNGFSDQKEQKKYQLSETDNSFWRNQQFRAYLGATAFTGTALSMQQLLISWLLVGILLLPADQVGLIQGMIGLPGIALMLWGGARADKKDARDLLVRVYGIAWLIPLALYACINSGLLNIWTVSLFGLAMGTAFAFSSPAQQAILNRVAGEEVQRAVTVATAIGFVVQMGGLALAGQMEIVGIDKVLMVQAISLILGALAVRRIAPRESIDESSDESIWQSVLGGLRASYRNKTIFQTMLINFVSSIFNFGAFSMVVPFIIKRVYEGDAISLATILIVFYGGATVSNMIQFKIMPIARPGLWFLLMQLTRVLILGFLWLTPDWWLLMVVLFFWGTNMGVTSTLSRAIVQESAEPQHLARILSVFSLGLLGAMPLGALILGFIIEAFGTMNGLIPAMVASLLLCTYGFLFTDVWRYRSPGS
ncbi:MAG: hypothetical protein CMQ19_07055 [Gammaproteobacteria bacterium]|jgi:predicted MFS family arabinose efflux permease|nr:hypothetical protein [Gammaproteobacteria bacterium]|tara:strand:+ start:2785 stop:4062 length:1278 start_codon:yes stop_codon:yes gene_type:complete